MNHYEDPADMADAAYRQASDVDVLRDLSGQEPAQYEVVHRTTPPATLAPIDRFVAVTPVEIVDPYNR